MWITVLQTASSAKEAERLIQDLAPDVVFMDIHMHFWLTCSLPTGLFTTAFDRYAVDAVRKQITCSSPSTGTIVRASNLDAFLPPPDPGKGALSWQVQRLEILTSGKRHFVRHRDIVVARLCRITKSKNLKRVEEMLGTTAMVQLERVEACNCRDNTVVLDTGAVVPMAVRKREALKQRLSLLMSA